MESDRPTHVSTPPPKSSQCCTESSRLLPPVNTIPGIASFMTSHASFHKRLQTASSIFCDKILSRSGVSRNRSLACNTAFALLGLLLKSSVAGICISTDPSNASFLFLAARTAGQSHDETDSYLYFTHCRASRPLQHVLSHFSEQTWKVQTSRYPYW